VRVRIRGRDQRPDQGKRDPKAGDGPTTAAGEPVVGSGGPPGGRGADAPSEERAVPENAGMGEGAAQSPGTRDESEGTVENQVIARQVTDEPDVIGEESVLVVEDSRTEVAPPAVLPEKDTRGVVAEEGEVQRGPYIPRPIPRILAVANQKGGVGKTTTAVNLGAALAELGYRVLVVDLDPQGNATTGLGIDARSFESSMYDVLMRDVALEDAVEPTSMKNLFVAPATIDLAGAEIELVPSFSRELKLRKALEAVYGDFEFILIDCPPSLGLITVNGLAAAEEVLVPIQCEYYALEGLGQLLRNVHLVQANLNDKLEVSTIVLTMYDARTKLAEQVADEVRLHFGNKVCKNVIPRTVRISEAPSFGQPITVFDPTSRGAIAYRELAKEVSGGEA